MTGLEPAASRLPDGVHGTVDAIQIATLLDPLGSTGRRLERVKDRVTTEAGDNNTGILYSHISQG
jgi:hypothetical protein